MTPMRRSTCSNLFSKSEEPLARQAYYGRPRHGFGSRPSAFQGDAGSRQATHRHAGLISRLLFDLFLAVAALDEAALGFERRHVGLAPASPKSRSAPRGPPPGLDQPLVDADALAVALAAIGGGNMEVAVDQVGQVHRHQPPRILGIGVERRRSAPASGAAAEGCG